MPSGCRIIKTLFSVSLFCSVIIADAQSFEEYKQRAQSSYNAYKDKAEADYENYRARVNADFAVRMKRAWPERTLMPGVPKPIGKEPVVPPEIPELDIPDIPQDNELQFESIVPLAFEDEPLPIVPKLSVPESEKKTFVVSFYGTERTLRFNPQNKLRMADASEDSAAEMWVKMSNSTHNGLLNDCLLAKKEMLLCDWGYYSFVKSVAGKIYGDTNEEVMLRAFLMSQSGYKIRIARNGSGKMFLLASFSDDLYDFPYFDIKGERYYLTEPNSNPSLFIFDQEFPNEKSIRMSITRPVSFAVSKSSSKSLYSKRYPSVAVSTDFNRNLIDFYNDYPASCKKNDSFSQWVHYANSPISPNVKENIYPVLQEAVRGKSQAEAANILINFVQTGFKYKKDDEVWGYERSFFPEETLYYEYSDCEDRAILYSRLVRDILGLKTVLLYYPGHLASAVAFTDNIPGDYIIVSGTRYLVCDPTYIGADIGMSMPGKDNSRAIVVMLD